MVSLRQHAPPPPTGYSLVRVDRRSRLGLGNPYRVGAGLSRGQALTRYRRLLRRDLARHGARARALEALRRRLNAGERLALACWCAPLPCHADALRAELLRPAAEHE